jgi:hypothetical protein
MKHWTATEIAALQRLRERFLTGTAGAADYWRSTEELALYDRSLGERIGWKWDAVLRELAMRGWRPSGSHVLDWGCGTGIASRRVLGCWPQFTKLSVHDRSAQALRFAAEQVRGAFPTVKVQAEEEVGPGSLLLVSHVINELAPASLSRLLRLAANAADVIWVEAGTHADSRGLVEVREQMLARGFQAIAPCTHQARCGMLAPENARHWCHHFAAPPPEAFQNARWAEFGRELNIDLRSLPYSFLVLSRRESTTPPGFARVIGRARDATGFSKILSSEERGVAELVLQKRDAPALLREIRKGPEVPIYRWTVEAGKIKAGEPLPLRE